MRAIRIREPGGPEVLAMSQAERPHPGPGQVLVGVRASGVNRADLLQRLGRYPAPQGYPPDIPGLEFAGVVEALGNGVRSLREGDRVMAITGGGAYAEAVLLDADDAVPIPDDWSFEDAAAVPEAFITAHDALLVQAGLRPGETVLVHAVGSSVGLALLQVARLAGATVAGTSRSAWKLERAAEYGLDRPVRVESVFAPDAALTDWANVVADLVGGPYLPGNLTAAAPRGRLIQIGLTAGRRAEVDLGALLRKRLTLVGTVLRSRPAAEKTTAARAFADWWAPHVASGELRPVVDRAFPAEQAAAAHRYVEENRNFGSVVLTWS